MSELVEGSSGTSEISEKTTLMHTVGCQAGRQELACGMATGRGRRREADMYIVSHAGRGVAGNAVGRAGTGRLHSSID